MRLLRFLGTSLALATGIFAISNYSTSAIQLTNGTVSFDKSPRLIDATATFKGIYDWGATYYFTLSLPEDAGEPLQRVTIAQNTGLENIRFNLEDSTAFEGKPGRKGQKLTLKEVTRDSKSRTVSVTFDPPVSPGKTVTIGLDPVRNPGSGGVYLFGITAFPAGEKPYGLYLGVGRLHFYEDGLN